MDSKSTPRAPPEITVMPWLAHSGCHSFCELDIFFGRVPRAYHGQTTD